MHRGVRRTLTAVAAAELVPVPLLDTWLQNHARRWLVHTVATQEGIALTEDQVAQLADEPLAPLKRIALWPVKTVLKKVFFVAGAYVAVQEARRVLALPGAVVASTEPAEA